MNNGKIVPILLYPPRSFVEARVTSTPEKRHRVHEVAKQYATFDALIDKEDGINYQTTNSVTFNNIKSRMKLLDYK